MKVLADSARQRGNAAVEVCLLLPWLVFTFVATLDFGFCAYSLIATQNAARVVAMYGAVNSTNLANIGSVKCAYAADELKYAPTPVSGCGSNLSVNTLTTTTPGSVSISQIQVSVTYTVNLMAVPGLMPGSLAITRTATLPVRG